jgi:Tfp pilus assembly protein PilE
MTGTRSGERGFSVVKLMVVILIVMIPIAIGF